MKALFYISILLVAIQSFAQQLPVNCSMAVPGCTVPNFAIVGTNPPYNTVDFTAGSISNPSTNPNGGNQGCLLSGETVSTFITINVVTSGTLQWSIVSPTGTGCFDWIMWPNVNNNGCAGINGNTLPPVACNWNFPCNGNTGMASPGNLPPGGAAGSYEAPLTVTAGQQFILCLSNFSFTNQSVNLNFFGSANVSCSVSAPNKTICQGNSTTVTISTPGYTNPIFQWLVTTGVSNPTGGTNVTVNPTVTTTYQVKVTQPATLSAPALIDTATFTVTVIPPLTPNAGPDQVVCFGSPITLAATPAVAPVTGGWQIIAPTGLTPAATATFSPNFASPTPTVTVNQPGIYKFVWRLTSTLCGVARDTMTVIVSEQQISASSSSPACVGDTNGTISINSANAVEYSYDNGLTWVPNASQSTFQAGTYTVCAKNALGCSKCTTVTVIDPAPIVLTVSNDTIICQNGTANLIASATGGTSFSFHWNHTTSLAANQQVSPATTSDYLVYAENQLGCVSLPDSRQVALRDPITASLTPMNQSVCPGYPGTISVVNLAGGIGQPYDFTWSTGAVNSGVVSSITSSPLTTTTYSVTIEDACESTPLVISTDIITYPLPVPMISVDQPTKCEPASFVLTNETDPLMSGATVWNISDGQQFMNMDEIIPDDLYAGMYDVQLVVTTPDGCIDSTTFNSFLNVQPKPNADFRWSPDPITMFNTQVLFTNYSSGADTYQWFFQDAVPNQSSAENQEVMFPDGQTGLYDVILIANSTLGCSDTTLFKVPVKPEVLIYAPNAFTPDGDEFNQSWSVVMEGIDVFVFDLLIYNRWGEVIWESHDVNAAWDGTYKGKIVPAGIYNWTIRTKDALNDKKYEFTGSINVLR